MIVTVTLNPCIDKTMVIEKFQYGGLNRAVATRQDISGKGINVAKALKQLGAEAICMGFNFNDNGVMLETELKNSDIPFDFVDVKGRIRTNVKIFESTEGIMTEINEKGDFTGEESIGCLLEKVERWGDGDVLVLSGSVPQGVGTDIYRRIIERAVNATVILDAEGDFLMEGLKARPSVIKPNLFELETAFGVELKTHGDIVALCRRIIVGGVTLVCVSMGKDGAIMVSESEAFYAPALKIPIKGIQGAGDSLVAGICVGLQKNASTREILRFAMAAAGGSLIREGTQMCTAQGFAEMLELVKIDYLDVFK